jgi:SAM-dependent methyltransferase
VRRPTVAATVGLLSAASVGYEVLLVRLFAIEQFHHVAYMAISIAMLGYGASGTVVALAGTAAEERTERWFPRVCLLTTVSLLFTPLAVRLVPLDLTQLLWDRRQVAYLGITYSLLALPFFFSGTAVLLGLKLAAPKLGSVYGASFGGAGLGAGAAIALLWLVVPAQAVLWPALAAALGTLLASFERRSPWRAVGLVTVAVTGLTPSFVAPSPRVSQYKALPQAQALPGARTTGEYTSPVGWVSAVRAPAFRYAPGLSLQYTGSFPEQVGLFVDGEIAGSVSLWSRPEEREMLYWLATALPFALRPRKVLIVGAGSGTEVEVALAHGSEKVVALELHPGLVELARAVAAGRDPFSLPGVRTVTADARAYVARSPERFDLVTLGPSGTPGSAAAGVHALNEDFLHTVDAYRSYLAHLTPHGALAITRWIRIPPREEVRMVLTAAEALRRIGAETLSASLVVARSWGTVTLLVKPSGFRATELEALSSFAHSRGLDLDWYPGVDTTRLRPLNQLDEPVLTRAAAAAVHSAERAREFASTYQFRVEPVGDSRPYPHQFLNLRALKALLGKNTGSWIPFAEWGYLALVATLVQSTAIALVLVLVPVAARRGLRASSPAGLVSLAAYFSLIGIAYLAAEIALIQQLQLMLGHPVYAVAVVFSALLIFSGAGSILSDRLDAGLGGAALAAGGSLLGLYSFTLLASAHLLHGAPLEARAAAGVALLLPVALAMGTAFPLGLRGLVRCQGELAWAWALNGFASVVGASLAALIAVEVGSQVLLAVAAGAYLLAAAVYSSASSGRARPVVSSQRAGGR